jgi:hypothetical protein
VHGRPVDVLSAGCHVHGGDPDVWPGQGHVEDRGASVLLGGRKEVLEESDRGAATQNRVDSIDREVKAQLRGLEFSSPKTKRKGSRSESDGRGLREKLHQPRPVRADVRSSGELLNLHWSCVLVRPMSAEGLRICRTKEFRRTREELRRFQDGISRPDRHSLTDLGSLGLRRMRSTEFGNPVRPGRRAQNAWRSLSRLDPGRGNTDLAARVA